MSVIKGKQEDNLLLDFSGKQYSKNKIRAALMAATLSSIKTDENTGVTTFVQHHIKIGMYTVKLWVMGQLGEVKLKDIENLSITLHESNSLNRNLEVYKDPRFKGQYWRNPSSLDSIRIKHLVDIIAHCQRLEKLKAFL